MSEPRLTRRDENTECSERALRATLSSEGLAPYAWGNPPGDAYPPHRHTFSKILVCVVGSIRIDLVDIGTSIDLAPGDRLDLPAGILHAASVGAEGVTCLEAHRNH